MNKIISNKYQLLLGILFIIPGILIYMLERPSWQTPWLAYHLFNPASKYILFGTIGYNLPSFFHVVSLALITSGIYAFKKVQYIKVCVGWILFNSIFEILQMNFIQNISDQKWIYNYSLHGVFDSKDILAICLGGCIAYFILIITQKPIKNENKKQTS